MTSDNHQIVRCQCSAKLRVPAAAVGRKVACPKCGFKILVGAPAAASSPAPPPVPVAAPTPPADEFNLLDDFLSSEASSETTQGPDLAAHQKACPKCKAQITKDAKVCLSCGYDPAIIGNEPVKKSVTASKVGKLAAGTGRFGIGCALSAGGALLAAGVWYGVAIGTGFEIGYIAWGVGLLAGLGMKIGYGQENMRGAMAAMVMAAIGILAAKGMIFKHFTSSFDQLIGGVNVPRIKVAARADLRCGYEDDLKGYSPTSENRKDCDAESLKYLDMDEAELAEARQEIDQWFESDRWTDPDYAKTRLVYLYALDMPGYGDDIDVDDEEWEWDEEKAERDWQRRHTAAVQKVDALPDDQWVAIAKEMEQRKEQEIDEAMEELQSAFGVGSKTFFSAMFGPIDALFILLALGTAIKLGGGQED
jgi:hypothetical protein